MSTMQDVEGSPISISKAERGEPLQQVPSTKPPPIKRTTTTLSTLAPEHAAETLSNFASSSANPRNWRSSHKWKVTLTIALTGFISTSGSSIVVPGAHEIQQEFGVEGKVGLLVTGIYVLGLGAGPFVFAPLSELYGRQPAYILSQFLLIIFSIGSAFSQNITTLIILRFFCGMWGSSGPGLGVATCADMFEPNQRGRPISVYAIGPMAGPVLGSMLGYWILYGGWRWLLWALTIMAAINTVLFLFLTEETYAPVLEKILKYRISHPIEPPTSFLDKISLKRLVSRYGWMSEMVSSADAKHVFGTAFSRPPRVLLNPVAFVFAVYYAYIYAIIYLFLVSVPLLYGQAPWRRPGLFSYEWSRPVLSFAYVGLGIGASLATIVAAGYQDKIYKYLSKRNGDQGHPEYRLVLTQIGMIIMPIGLLIFGWTAHAQTHWIGPQIGECLLLFGLQMAFNSIQNFIVDAFFPYSAAGIAAITAVRSITACVMPLFAPDMFQSLGWGWGGTLLALVGIAGIPAPAIMFIWGKKLREKYKFEG